MRPPALWTPSPNFKASTLTRGISCFVVHATATAAAASPLAHLCDPCVGHEADRVSAHWLVDRDGTVYHLVHESNIAWHAGVSRWRDRPNVNAFSIGMELVNMNDGVDPYSDPQLAAGSLIIAAACQDYGIKAEDVVGHVDVVDGATPEEKAARLLLHSDPKGLPWGAFRARLAALGVA